MTASVIPMGSLPYVLYETLRAAAFLEHVRERRNEVGRQAVQKIKDHFAKAYPGSANEIDRLVAHHRIFVRKLIDILMTTGLGIQKGEEHILITYPQLCGRDTEKLSVLIHLIAESNAEYLDGNDYIT